jgi:dethiobiotin synthetase
MAAVALGLEPFTIADLASEVRAGGADRDAPVMTFVEGAGGARSPIADDGDTVALAHALAADRIVIVADAGLGTINAVRLTIAALTSWAPTVALNRYDDGNPLHRDNRRWLSERDGSHVVTSPAELAADLTLPGARPARS